MISTHLAGGCFQYSNEIIANWPCAKELVMPSKTCEPHFLKPDWTIKYYGYSSYIRVLSLVFCIMRILVMALRGKYSGLLLFGVSKWDYLILRFWHFIIGLPSYCIIHDGRMHEGEENVAYQKTIVRMMKMSTYLIFLSQYVRELVKCNFNIDKQSFIAPHGIIDYGHLPLTAGHDKPTLLFLGRIVKYKGIELLLEAIKKVPDELYDKLIIAGEWAYNNKCDYNSEKVEIVNRWLSNEEIVQYISLSDIMIFPYLEATQSGVATLSINYLKPAIVTNVGAFKEQFNDRSALFINPDVQELADAITDLLRHPEHLETMKSALLKLKDVYSWKYIAKELSIFVANSLKNR